MHAVAAAVVAGAAAKVALSAVFQQQRPRGEGIVVYEHGQGWKVKMRFFVDLVAGK